MHEPVTITDPRYCALLCTCWWDGCIRTPYGTVPQHLCGMTAQYKLDVLRREHGTTKSKPWFAEYAAKLKHFINQQQQEKQS